MSETDDTDVLVLVPPDFFAVETSDSDESLDAPFYNGRSCNSENHEGAQREVVNTLFHHVNRLENRLSAIESRNSFEADESDYRNTHLTHTNNFESPKKSIPSIFQATPHKYQQLTSLPSTPCNAHIDYLQKSHSLPRRKPRSYQSYDSAHDLESVSTPHTHSNMSYQEQGEQKPNQNYLKSNNITPSKEFSHSQLAAGDVRTVTQPRYNAELMDEIDQFLNSVAKTPQAKRSAYERSKQDSLYKCGENSASIPELSFGLREFNSLPVREEPVTIKHMSQLESQSQKGEQKRLNLPEVEKLLKEMETTQNIIEYKLRQKEAQFGRSVRDNAAFPRRSLQSGDSIGSVPDLGFGIRDMATEQMSDKKRTPVIEDKVIKRSMSLCGVNPSDQVANKTLSQKPNSDGNVHKTFTPRRLELGNDPGSIPDLGFGLVNWYRNNPASNSQTNSTHPKSIQETEVGTAGNYVEGGSASSVPDLGFGLRDLWSTDGTLTTSGNQRELNSQSLEKVSLHSDSNPSARSTTSGPVSTAVEAPCTKKVDFSTEPGFKDTRISEHEYTSVSKPNSFLSLSELWGSSGVATAPLKDPSDLKQRLEEEKYRREHCERLIQQLQSRLLEEQQKLAVAVQVDTAKDGVIRHFQGAWTQLVSHWNELEEQRHELATQLHEDRERYQASVGDSLHKLKRYELELSQSLDMAHSYKEKFEQIEREKNEFTKSEIQKFHAKIQERDQAVLKANQDTSRIQGERGELFRKIGILEEESKKDRAALLKMRSDLDHKTKVVNGLEADSSALKEGKETVQLMLREEKSRNTLLEQQKKNLQIALEESKKREKQLQEEVKATGVNGDTLKKELRDFYQEQVEIVVRDKLQEFQAQLDAAEKSLRIELETREQTITGIASKQISQISEKHQLEVKLLEEKHKEELQLYQLKLAQATSHIQKLQNKVKSSANRKGEIVEQLHGVMEAQWQQALRIINGNSPSHPQSRPSKSQTNGADRSCASSVVNQASYPVPPLDISQCTSRPSTCETPFGKDGQVTYRAAPGTEQTNGQKIENDLRKYIEMLLNRSPGSADLDNGQWQQQPKYQSGRPQESVAAVANTKQLHWERVDPSIEQQDGRVSAPDYDSSRISQNSASKDSRLEKPPWK